jgi:hypothetical protein
MLIDPVDGAERTAAGVVVDIDECAAFEALEAGAGDAIALEEDSGDCSGGIDVVSGSGVMNPLKIGKSRVSGGDGIDEDDVGFASELVEDLGEGEDGAYGVTVGARVGGEK